jgi:broad specificity phosphatase PhoE
MSKPKKIFLIRHGQSTGNVNREIYSQQPDYALDLTPLGVTQAIEAGKLLKTMLHGKKTAVYYSPFFRAIKTLNNIVVGAGKEIINPDFVREDPRIREQEWHRKIPLNYDNESSKVIERERDLFGTFYYRFDGGESCADVYDRVSDFINTLNRDFEKTDFPKNATIVMHGMTMRVFMMRWFHKQVQEFEQWGNPKNCQIWVMTLNENTNKYEFDFSQIPTDPVIHPYQCKLEIV